MKRKDEVKTINNFLSAMVIGILSLILLMIFLPMIFGLKGYYIKTDSMSPNIPKGSLVLDEEIELKQIKSGDILTFTNDDKSKQFTHRVLSVNYDTGMIHTKGDANKDEDPSPTDFKYAVGRVSFSIPFVGYAAMGLSTVAGKIIIAAIFIAWIAVEIELFIVRRKEKGDKI